MEKTFGKTGRSMSTCPTCPTSPTLTDEFQFRTVRDQTALVRLGQKAADGHVFHAHRFSLHFHNVSFAFNSHFTIFKSNTAML